MVEKADLHDFDIQELFEHVYEAEGYDAIADAMCEVAQDPYEIAADLVRRLLPMADVGRSPLTGKMYQYFAKHENGHSVALVKHEVDPQEDGDG